MSGYEEALARLVAPQRAQLVPTCLPRSVRTLFSVTGSKGKTSAAYALNLLVPGSCRFTSPHCFSVRERIGFGAAPVSEAQLVDLLDGAAPAHAGFFGGLAAGYQRALERSGCSAAVCEAGIGGLMDPTNAPFAGRKIGVLTSLELEHTDVLGPALDDIAYQKLGYFQGAQRLVVPRSLDLCGYDAFYGLRVVRVPDLEDKFEQNLAVARRAALEAGVSTRRQTGAVALPGRFRVVRVDGQRMQYQGLRGDLGIYEQLAPRTGGGTRPRDPGRPATFVIDSAHTPASVVFASRRCARLLGTRPVTLVFCQTSRARDARALLDAVRQSLRVSRVCYLPASSSLDLAHSTAEDRLSAQIGADLALPTISREEFTGLRGDVFVTGSEHGACLAEWLLLRRYGGDFPV